LDIQAPALQAGVVYEADVAADDQEKRKMCAGKLDSLKATYGYLGMPVFSGIYTSTHTVNTTQSHAVSVYLYQKHQAYRFTMSLQS
jgi:hypothetical protein